MISRNFKLGNKLHNFKGLLKASVNMEHDEAFLNEASKLSLNLNAISKIVFKQY